MVLLPALQDLTEAPHFDVAPDDRIELAKTCLLHEVMREARQHV